MHIFGDKALYFAFTVCTKILAKVIGRIPLLSSDSLKPLSIEGAPAFGLSAAGTEGQRHK